MNIFVQFLSSEGFTEVIMPKLLAGSSKGRSHALRLNRLPACLAQSPQLHKRMFINADYKLVFVVGSVFKAEDSYTHRHLGEFTGLDVEMEHYSEVMDIVDSLFVTIFDSLNASCQKELEDVGRQ